MGFNVISFNELSSDFNGREVHLRTTSKDLAVIKILEVVKDVDTVSIKYEFVSGDSTKFKPQGASAVLSRGKKMWGNSSKYWLPYLFVQTSRYDLPENNDGRDTCRHCGAPTRKCGGWNNMTDYRVCTKCGL